MEPVYSLILLEPIVPDVHCDLPSTYLRIMVMARVAAFELSEKQWPDLLMSVGLTNVSFYQLAGSGEGIIKAIKFLVPAQIGAAGSSIVSSKNSYGVITTLSSGMLHRSSGDKRVQTTASCEKADCENPGSKVIAAPPT
ncbi:uncharacterized protein N7500_004128 [Penicillium coprophilum]|uniref:uncharacterized protein n=1 Tax=Penicillium coprophilum TaxID=36646 RepID=UPI0023A41BF2|nr:uncharacterized protein N7500_004128 [Penicillium coprophilum]KAJ5171345.1 hypothetical protein N7500_004128 [Penicillium coprophilum]